MNDGSVVVGRCKGELRGGRADADADERSNEERESKYPLRKLYNTQKSFKVGVGGECGLNSKKSIEIGNIL